MKPPDDNRKAIAAALERKSQVGLARMTFTSNRRDILQGDSDSLAKKAAQAKHDYQYEMVMGMIPYYVDLAAYHGDEIVQIMELTSDDYVIPSDKAMKRPENLPPRDALESEWLTGVAKHVFATCKEQGLSPFIETITEPENEVRFRISFAM